MSESMKTSRKEIHQIYESNVPQKIRSEGKEEKHKSMLVVILILFLINSFCVHNQYTLSAERTPYPHNAEHNGKADGTDCGQEACSGLIKKKRTPPKPRRIQSRKIHLGKRSQIRIRCLRRIPEEGTNSGRGGRSGRCVQQSAVQTADETPSAIWR